MVATTIKIHRDTKHELDLSKGHRNEHYDNIIRKLVYNTMDLRIDHRSSM